MEAELSSAALRTKGRWTQKNLPQINADSMEFHKQVRAQIEWLALLCHEEVAGYAAKNVLGDISGSQHRRRYHASTCLGNFGNTSPGIVELVDRIPQRLV